MGDNDVLLQVRGDVSDIKAKLAEMKTHLRQVNEESKKVGNDSQQSWAKFAAGIAAGWMALQQLADKTKMCIEAQLESEAATMKLAVAMRNQGDYTQEALDDLTDYAGVLQDLTGYEDDATVSLMGNLKTYGMVNEEVKAASKAALDFATAKKAEGMTVEAAGEIIGKAYVGQTERLKRYGIIVDENLSRSQKYEAVMKQLNERFGGAAQADLATYAGQWRKLKSELGDIAEILGLAMLKAIEGVTFAFSMMGAGFWKVVSLILESFGVLTGAASKFAKFVGMEGIGEGLATISGAMESGAKNAQDAADAAIVSADKYYKMLTSFHNVDDAVTGMKPGKRFIPVEADKDAESAEKRRKELLSKSIEDRVRAIEEEAVVLSKALDDEQKETAKHYDEATKIAREGGLAALQATLDAGNAAELAKSAAFERGKKMDAEQAAAREADIQARITEIDLAEAAGKAHRDTLTERIALEEEKLRLQNASLEKIDKVTDSSSWYAQASAIAATRKSITDLSREIAMTNPFDAIALGLRDIANDSRDVGKKLSDAMTRAFDGMTDSLTDFVMTGKGSFADLANSIIRDMVRIQIQQSITGPLASSGGNIFSAVAKLFSLGSGSGDGVSGGMATSGGYSGGSFAGFHGGGKVGLPPAMYRIVLNPDLIPRRHGGGLAPNERMTVSKINERFITEEQNEWLTSVAKAVKGTGSRDKGSDEQGMVNIIITANDAKSFEDMCRRNPAAITGPVLQSLRDNKTRTEFKRLVS